MTVLATGLSTANRACLASCQGGLYYTNGFDPVKVWYGLSATLDSAGITGPAAVIGAPTTAGGGFDNGDHLFRYRFKNTKTGYVSNPSPALTYTVSGSSGLLSFSIGAAATAIIRSTDTKVDQILLEATAVGGGAFYQAGTAANTAVTIQVGMADTSLIQQFGSDASYGSSTDNETYSSEVPPLGTIAIPYRGQLWIMGDEAIALTGVTFTSASTAVSGTGFSTNWAGRLITRTGDTTRYEIASVASAVAMTLSVAYVGSTVTTTAQVTSKFPNRGYYSRTFFPEQFYASKWARDFLANRSDQVVAGTGRKDGLYVFGRYSAERLIYNGDPSVGAGAVLSPLQGRRGCFHQRCLTDVEGELYAWDRQGMWIVGEVPRHISRPIDKLLEEYVDYSKVSQFHVSFEPANRLILFFFVKSDDTYPQYAAAYEIDSGRWCFYNYLQGITASSVVPTTDGQVRLMLGDSNGYSWYAGIDGSFDGTPPTCETVVDVIGTPTTTVIQVSQVLPIVAPTLAGVVLYNPATGESSPITSNTADTITLTTALSAAPAVDAELYLGPIGIEYRTKWWVGPGQDARKDPLYLVIKLFPGSSTGTMRVYFYADFSTVPSPLTAFVADEWPDGVAIATGNYYIDVALDGGSGDGMLSVPVPIEWSNVVQARITSTRPDGDFRVLDMQFALTQEGTVTDVGT